MFIKNEINCTFTNVWTFLSDYWVFSPYQIITLLTLINKLKLIETRLLHAKLTEVKIK